MTEIICVQNEYNLAHRGDDAVHRPAGEGGGGVRAIYSHWGTSRRCNRRRCPRSRRQPKSTPMQVALAWLLQRSPNMLLIPGTSSLGRLQEASRRRSFSYRRR